MCGSVVAWRRMIMAHSIKVKVVGEFVPEYQSKLASGCDLCACVANDVVLKPGRFCVVPTGICIEIPEGYEAQVRPRSGLAAEHGIGIVNAPGTIDADYRGEIKVILFNYGQADYVIRRGDRIAQMVFSQTTRAEFIVAETLSGTGRGEGGFGHTGK